MAFGLNIVVGKSVAYLIWVMLHSLQSVPTQWPYLEPETSLNFWEIMPIGMALAMLSGRNSWHYQHLRLRGDYLAIVTLGFGEIVRISALNTR